MAQKVAQRLLDRIFHSIASLSEFPQRIKLTEEEPWYSYGIHKMQVSNFLIYFWIDEENRKVQIIAIIYNKRDQLKILINMDIE